ncbi:MAG: hypothetical protein IJ062_10260 [Firmicutes bacterium]|nr:hypothetical protein [Bacillota bacterium]
MTKKINLWFVLSVLFILSFCMSASAADKEIVLKIDDPVMTVNNSEKEIDGFGTAPIISNGRTLLPIRAVVEEMGGSVEWNAENKQTELKYADTDIVLTTDSKTALLNGAETAIDTAPVIINARTFLPIRFIAESFGFSVDWNSESKTITILSKDAGEEAKTAEPANGEVKTTEPASGSKPLVVYFSVTGNTDNAAKKIAAEINADIYKIEAKQPYTDEDINYNDDNSRTSIEQNDKSARPEIDGTIENFDDYSLVFVGYPIWWGDSPRIMSTFAESYDFTDKTVVPFCTSASSPIGSSTETFSKLAKGGKWLDGKRFSADASQTEISEWIKSLDLN